MTPVITLANAQLFRGRSGWRQIWLVRGGRNEVCTRGVGSQGPFFWPARSPYPQEKSWDTELQKCHTFIHKSPPAPRDREERTHTHPHMVIKSQVCHYKAEGKTGKYCTVNCRGPHPHPVFNGGQPQLRKVDRLMAGIA